MSYVVSTEVINGAGICLGEELIGEDYTPYVHTDLGRTPIGNSNGGIIFNSYQGNYDQTSRGYYTHQFGIHLFNLVEDYIRRVYNLSDDIEITIRFGYAWGSIYDGRNLGTQRTFETQAEALEYVDTLGNPNPLFSVPYRGSYQLFIVEWRQEIDGVFITRSVSLDLAEDPVSLYTINDFVNLLALFFGVAPEEVPVEYALNSSSNVPQDTPEPSYDCETYIKATVIDVDGPGDTVEIDIDFTGGSIPGDVTVTTIDGDPDLILTEIANGDGSVTIHDNGNIIMSNDGGTFFLNEFGNVGFYANNDASLTANTQVQLGVGGTSITVENDCFTFRDGTGNVELTADELTRLKALLD